MRAHFGGDVADGPDATRRVARVVTGGQSGVDRAATDVAIAYGVPYGGWVPREGWAEDHVVAPGVLTRYPAFCESPSVDPAVRTARNVAEADATLLLVLDDAPLAGHRAHPALRRGPRGPLRSSSSSRRPRATRGSDRSWPSSRRDCTLNVAGPRESEQPGVYDAARSFLEAHQAWLFGARAVSDQDARSSARAIR